MAKTWKAKNEQLLEKTINANEQEIKKIHHHLQSFYSADHEIAKMETRIQFLTTENERLRKIIPSSLNPEEIIRMTRASLPESKHTRTKQGSLIKIPFVDNTAPENLKNKQAIWKFAPTGWEYERCE